MAEELGKIQKPSAEEFKKGRRLFFVPLIYEDKDSPDNYFEKVQKYWKQVEEQLTGLEQKLGLVNRIYHELVSLWGEEGVNAIKGLNEGSYRVARSLIEKGAQVEAVEDESVLTEFMDWGRCLAIGLQSQSVFETVYRSYIEASKKRNESIARRLDETLKTDEIGVLFMRERHQVQFPAGVEVFYIAPPALDEINRWLRDYESWKTRKSDAEQKEQGGNE